MYAVYVSRRRLRRRDEKVQRHTPLPSKPASAPSTIIHQATCVERIAYTRAQAAEALGISRSTFNRRVLPLIETVDMPWGARLIPVDELQRLLTERRRRPVRQKARPTKNGRPAELAPEIADRIHTERAAGRSLAEIARELNASGTPTAHGGAQWWASTVRAVLRRAQT